MKADEVKKSNDGKSVRGGSTQLSFDREREIFEDAGNRSRDNNEGNDSWRSRCDPFSSSHIDLQSKGSESRSEGTEAGSRRQSGVVQKLRSKTQSNSSDSSSIGIAATSRVQNHSEGKGKGREGDSTVFSVSSVSCEEERVNRKSKKADMESLVNNFEKGLTLKRLQMELTESKESLDKSREAIQSISDSFRRGSLG